MLAMYLIAAHMAGDYLFQTKEMATYKLKDRAWRATHVTIYTACFVPIAVLQGGWKPHLFLIFLAIAHYITDSYRWRTDNPWPAMPILHNQSLHAVQLAILGGLFLT